MKPKTKPTISNEIIDQLLANYTEPADLIGPHGILKMLKSRLINRVLEAELSDHLGYEKHDSLPAGQSNTRNGHSAKTLRSDDGPLPIQVPRDRQGEFTPLLIPKHQRHFDGFDQAIISLYSRGLSVREIQQHLLEIYQVEISPSLITNVTDAVAEEVKLWQNRPLDSVYPIVYFDAVVVKIRQDGRVYKRAIYLALAISLEGKKEVLGMWTSENEGARFWLNVATELKNRGLQDIYICCVDGLSGFDQALKAVYPRSEVQRCIVHQLRNSLKYVSWKERKTVSDDLKTIYTAPTEAAARQALQAFRDKHDSRYPAIGKSWEAAWEQLSPFFAYPPVIRRIIYTTNAIESLNSTLRKTSRHCSAYPTTESLYKLFYLALRNLRTKWTQSVPNWPEALNHFSIKFADRMPSNI